MLEKDNLREEFKKYYKQLSDDIYFSPGRVNIIGEHIDYNGGHVMPMAVTLGIYGVIKYTDLPYINTISIGMNNNKICSIDMNNLKKTNDYLDYIRGILYAFKKNRFLDKYDKGFDIYITSTLPASSGLSSSAAMELLFSHIINDYYSLGLTNNELVNLSVEAEREYINVNCGIMDQFAIGMSELNKVIYLDTNTSQYDLIPFEIGDNTLVIINTKKPRNLIESKYNIRRSECEKVQEVLDKMYHKGALVNYTIEELNSIKDKITNDEYKRARHVINEEIRVKLSIDAMKNKDYQLLGKLLKESHESLKNDYEVSGLELDTISEYLNNSKYVLGARMTGAGFGGCAIALFNTTDANIIDSVMEELKKVYKSITNLDLEYYYAKSSDKTHKME